MTLIIKELSTSETATRDNFPSSNCVKDNKAELPVPELSAQISTQMLWNNPWSWRERILNFTKKGRENNFIRQNGRESELKSTIQLNAIANYRRDVFLKLWATIRMMRSFGFFEEKKMGCRVCSRWSIQNYWPLVFSLR